LMGLLSLDPSHSLYILKPVWFLVFGFSKNQSLVAVIPGLENAEDFPRAK
jgi:hypothetical protein